MRKYSLIIALGLCATLSACGNSEAPAPEEQIVVREPGQTTKQASADNTVPGNDLVAAGKLAFAQCSACHSVTKDAPSGAGPNLYGVVGRKAASLKEFAYSSAMQDSAIVWNEDELDAYLANPAAKVPGTTMAAVALKDAEKRKAVVTYLASLAE